MPTRRPNPVQKLAKAGQSVWLDNISRSLITGGRLDKMIAEGLRGLTSNPTIFEKAVVSTGEYDRDIRRICRGVRSVLDIYDILTIRDIQDAADAFKKVYEETGGLDGYVSLEINPKFAHDTEETIREGRRLYEKVARPNLMLKVPATLQGFPAVEEFIASGFNVNVTLIFALSQYEESATSYIAGLRRLQKSGGDLSRVRSVASVFVSRIDTVVDRLIEEAIAKDAMKMKCSLLEYLKGKAAAANCARIYRSYTTLFNSEDFQRMRSTGAHPQRVLWASTSTKNPAYSDVKYVTELVAPDTVNTLPENTYAALIDHGAVRPATLMDAEAADKVLMTLKEYCADIDVVCAQLLKEGLQSFVKSTDSLFDSIEKKTQQICASGP